MTGFTAEKWDDDFFVDGDEDEGIAGGKDWNGACWDFEMWAKFSVHNVGLAEEEC